MTTNPDDLASDKKHCFMKTLQNLEKSLVIAVLNTDYFGHNIFGLFHVVKQEGDSLKVNLLWNMQYPDSDRGRLDGFQKDTRTISVDDVWLCPNSLSEPQKIFIEDALHLEYRFYKDEDVFERLASKLGMDLMNIGYEGEPETGTYFSCCRVSSYERKILPEGFHVYSLRESDEDGSQPCSIENWVSFNHFGDILTYKPLPVPMQLPVETVEYDEEGCIIG